jgi:hypothetical protein
LAKESDRIYDLSLRLARRLKKLFGPRKKKETPEEEVEKVEEVQG